MNAMEENQKDIVDYSAKFNPEKDVWVIKKDGTKESFNINKVIAAIGKSAYRALTKFTEEEKEYICTSIINNIDDMGIDKVEIQIMHNLVEAALEDVKPIVAKSYRDYRNYKQDFVRMIDDVYKKAQSIMYIGDKENSNTDSALVATKRSLIFNQLNKELYQKFFMTTAEIQACRDGYIYVHDMSARRDTMNCCLFDISAVLTGGFEMGNVWYNEPNTLDTAFDVIGDITLSAASQQYGGFTLPSIDLVLEPYAEKSYKKYYEKYLRISGGNEKIAEEEALADVQRDFEQGFQGWEYKFNTVGSSRGDYPFIDITIGTGTGRFAKMASITMLNVRRKGQGKKGNKKPVLFPKIVFLYDKNLHGPGCELEDVFEAGIQCSAKTMYPDWLSLTGEGYVPSIYKKYGKIISPMGCRAFLSPWYERGGMNPADEKDVPVYIGRFNAGAISLHLPMILAKSRQEDRDFYEVLDFYLEMIRQLHIRTFDYLGEMKASTNPLAYCEGGFYQGHLGLHDKIKPLLKYATASFGITALAELQRLYNGKSLREDNAFALEVMEYINKKIKEYTKQDDILYAIYGTPAENLCFSEDTLVNTQRGLVPIKDIITGKDWVYSYNEKSGNIDLKLVTACEKTNNNAVVLKIYCSNGEEIICTPNHPFLTKRRKYVTNINNFINYDWMEAERLCEGSVLIARDMKFVKVTHIETLDDLIPTYNIEVEGNHNFFVGKGNGGVLVHNCGLQVKQFRKKYGIIENVSDREYISNSFHLHVTEDVTPIEKQDKEYPFWNLFNGGKIQYCKYPIDYNIEAIKTLVRRAMDMGYYEGINLSLSYCDDCGYEELAMDVCPKCGSKNLTKIDRMNGYLSYSRVHGDTRLNDAKMAEIAERKSM